MRWAVTLSGGAHIRRCTPHPTAVGGALDDRQRCSGRFIGPEVFRSAEQLERACLEDTVMAKLHGLTMGLDVCATFHMGIDPVALRRLTARIVERAAPAYLMSVAGNADPMLGYLTTSYREHPRLRQQVRRQMTSSMSSRLEALGVPIDGDAPRSDVTAKLFATYERAGGDRRAWSSLEEDGQRQLPGCVAGFDLRIDDPLDADRRLEAIYTHARAAYARRLASVSRRRPRRTRAARPPHAITICHPPARTTAGRGRQGRSLAGFPRSHVCKSSCQMASMQHNE
jgi:ethanolamine ammonia-lyase large subunit